MKQLLLALDQVIPEDRSGDTCRTCGAPLRGDGPLGGYCLACLLDTVLQDEKEAAAEIELFDQYQLMRHADGTPVELGRGAMGITYKAIDVDLRCPVTLKVISQKYVGDESARLRFLREARAAASVRHPNVASVFHLGRTGEHYFYAMEFVEGETLGNLLRRSGRLELRTALEIATQVTAGLAAVRKQNLVHRDIKPSNIMVNVEDEGAVTAKIIDLGLAKATNEPASQATISICGHFAGTPEYASPEQFAGVGLDIRSDLYSLGVMLWEMVTGKSLFGGSPAEVMHKHLHARLPLGQLEGVPQPFVSLIEKLLDKDPGRRFQSPAELLKRIMTIERALGERQTVTFGNAQELPPADYNAASRQPPANGDLACSDPSSQSLPHFRSDALGFHISTRCPKRISLERLPATGGDVFDREPDVAFLNETWENPNVNVVAIIGPGGVGKSTLVNHWLDRMAAEHYRSAEFVFAWSFRQSSGNWNTSSEDEFFLAALAWFGDPDPRTGTAWEKGDKLANLIAGHRTLLILDALESLQCPPGLQEGRLRAFSLQTFLRKLTIFNTGLCVMTTRLPVNGIADHQRDTTLFRYLDVWQQWRR